jgi:predicted TIM-barrel fold metal-dependent hydrolase
MKRCRDQHGIKVIRVHPGCHGYALSDAVFEELLGEATRAGLALQLVAQIEDVRTQHPFWRTRAVDLAPLSGLLERHPQARVMVLNANAAMFSTALRECSSVWADLAMLEGVGGVETLLQSWPREKLCLGTHAPFFYPEAGLLKIAESALAEELEAQVTASNARRFLG